MKYGRELDFLLKTVKDSADSIEVKAECVTHKSSYDIVTETDLAVEGLIIAKIKECFPEDQILSEEASPETLIEGRTWTIDPIDGTCNMAHGSPLYGVQASLIEDGEPVVAVVYLPKLGLCYTAVTGQGAWLNGAHLPAVTKQSLENSVVSFCDYNHKNPAAAARQHRAAGRLYPVIERIRMFGAASIDFTFAASSKTAGTVMITKNVWDIAPGLLVCRECGCLDRDLSGGKYKFGSDGLVVAATEELLNTMINALN